MSNPVAVTVDTLNSNIEFDCPFKVLNTRDGHTFIQSAHDDIYAPQVALSVDKDGNGVGEETIDDTTWNEPQTTWEAVNGYSGQYGYSGPTMHPSEYLGGGMARDVLEDEGAVYVVTTVECHPNWEIDEDDEEDVFQGQIVQDNPAGWMLLKLK